MAELAYIGIGSNLGGRWYFLVAGLRELAAVPGIYLEAVSSVYETAPVGYRNQPSFLNAVFSVRVSLSPLELLRAMRHIEDRHQRQRRILWGPRTLDLDLLLYGDLSTQEADLILPHPRMAERVFVLAPLCEIDPDLRHPVSGERFATRLRALERTQAVHRAGPFPRSGTSA